MVDEYWAAAPVLITYMKNQQGNQVITLRPF